MKNNLQFSPIPNLSTYYIEVYRTSFSNRNFVLMIIIIIAVIIYSYLLECLNKSNKV